MLLFYAALLVIVVIVGNSKMGSPQKRREGGPSAILNKNPLSSCTRNEHLHFEQWALVSTPVRGVVDS